MLEVILGEGPNPKVEIDGETFNLAPLRLSDFGEFRDWVKEKRLTTFFKAAKKAGLSRDQFNENVQDILGVTPDVDAENEEVDDDVIAQMGTEEGMEHLVYLSIKRNHPEVEKADLDLGFDDLEKLTTVIGEISGLPSVEEEIDEENPPKIKELNG